MCLLYMVGSAFLSSSVPVSCLCSCKIEATNGAKQSGNQTDCPGPFPGAAGPPPEVVQTQTSEWRRPRSGQVRQGRAQDPTLVGWW